MKLTVNGEAYDLTSEPNLSALLQDMGAPPGRVATMVNGNVVCSKDHESSQLKEGDEIEVVIFAGGG